MIYKISHIYLLDCQGYVGLLLMRVHKKTSVADSSCTQRTTDGSTEYRGCAKKTKPGRESTLHKRLKKHSKIRKQSFTDPDKIFLIKDVTHLSTLKIFLLSILESKVVLTAFFFFYFCSKLNKESLYWFESLLCDRFKAKRTANHTFF